MGQSQAYTDRTDQQALTSSYSVSERVMLLQEGDSLGRNDGSRFFVASDG